MPATTVALRTTPHLYTTAGSLDRFRIGEVHRLVISTDTADSHGMPTPSPQFYVISAVRT